MTPGSTPPPISASYELLDAGDGRRLERFGPRLVDRPTPAALWPATPGARWQNADLRFERDAGWASRHPDALEPWQVPWAGVEMELRPAAGGQVGLFPEQAPVLDWIARAVGARLGPGAGALDGPRLLNLFAYTGAATLVAAAAGARVAHVDASRTAVGWARRNAALSGLRERPIRWLIDDCVAFVRRELRRGVRYDGIVLDPPTFGRSRTRSSGAAAWQVTTGLADLLADCAALLDPAAPFVVLSAHTPDLGPDRLAELLAAALGTTAGSVEAHPLDLVATSGVVLPAGAVAAWDG